MNETRCALAVVCLIAVLGLPACSPSPPVRPAPVAPVSETLPSSARGIAFIRDGAAFVVGDGSAREVAADGAEKTAVGYSADGRSLLVTEARGTRRAVLMLPASLVGSASVVLDVANGSELGAVRVVPEGKGVFYSVFGDPGNRLLTSGLRAGGAATNVALKGTFSGEFDVDATGDGIVFTGSGQNPATLMLRTGSQERPLVAGLATAFTPTFSRDGARVCFTGSESAGAKVSLWIVDRDSDRPHNVAQSEGLTPTFPVFSPDGSSIACRNANDGSIWIVPTSGGEPTKLALVCDEAPIGW